jgi:hypothetical protein
VHASAACTRKSAHGKLLSRVLDEHALLGSQSRRCGALLLAAFEFQEQLLQDLAGPDAIVTQEILDVALIAAEACMVNVVTSRSANCANDTRDTTGAGASFARLGGEARLGPAHLAAACAESALACLLCRC